MSTCSQLITALQNKTHDNALSALYALDGSAARLDAARARAVHIAETFAAQCGADAQRAALFSGPGRTEIGGNHTDHQHGCVLCGSVDLDMLACAAPNGLNVVRIQSEGYPALEINLDDLSVKEGEINTSAALVRGVAAKIAQMGYKLSGFNACANSTVLSGSGLSSSAAYETLVGNIFNHFCCEDELDAVTIAKIGQYAENVYFGKPCGLMDQMGSSVGGAVAMDFNDPTDPVVEKLAFDPAAAGYALCIIDSGADHADLTDEYAAVTDELRAVCAHFGKSVLRDVDVQDFLRALPELRQTCGDRAMLRAIHVFDDNARVAGQIGALRRGDFDAFLMHVRDSGLSSWRYLQNVTPTGYTDHQDVALALALAERLLDTAGACRVHGGGFAGTIQAYVPLDAVDRFKSEMESYLGEGRCHILHIRPIGGCVVAE